MTSPQDPQKDSSAKHTEEPKGEVALALEELKKRGEKLLTVVGSTSDESKAPEKKITQGVINGKAIKLVQPPYPLIARSAHVSGPVAVLVIIDTEGKVMAAEAISGHPLLFGAAVTAAKASQFTATKLKGKPVYVYGQIIYNFLAQ
jgi:outer membrane biosynthesis protein TonB